jgi:NADPH2:quinone reductase
MYRQRGGPAAESGRRPPARARLAAACGVAMGSPMPASQARRLGGLLDALRGRSATATTAAATALPATMTAMMVTQGGLSLDEITTPQPRPGQVLVEVHASSVNPVDYKIFESRDTARDPWQPGFDVSGVVAAVGEGCGRLAVGDHVWADNAGYLGAAAEYVICDEARVGLKPAALSHVAAASLPLVALTSLQTLQHGHVTAGSKVLIIGGSSGCGYTGVMLAVAMGARVTATCSGRNVAFVQSLGAERVVDYTSQDWSEELKGAEFDCVVDMIGPGGGEEHTVPRAVACMAPAGRFISITTGDDEGAFEGTIAKRRHTDPQISVYE